MDKLNCSNTLSKCLWFPIQVAVFGYNSYSFVHSKLPVKAQHAVSALIKTVAAFAAFYTAFLKTHFACQQSYGGQLWRAHGLCGKVPCTPEELAVKWTCYPPLPIQIFFTITGVVLVIYILKHLNAIRTQAPTPAPKTKA